MMTIIHPQAAHMVPITATLTSPMHHGAGTSGNAALLRTQEVVLPDGTHTRVPYLSANSVRHGLRDALAWHAVHTLEIENGSMSKAVVDLLWSGGAVTTTGAQTDLSMARRVDETFPPLGLLGYAARSDIITGTLRVSDLVLVCRENRWRLPEGVASMPQAAQGSSAYRVETFGTRHDIASGSPARLIDTDAEAIGTQMIYEIHALATGSVLSGSMSLTPAAVQSHRMVLDAALSLWADGQTVSLGAKNAVGFGSAMLAQPVGDVAALEMWTDHLRGNRESILALLSEITA